MYLGKKTNANACRQDVIYFTVIVVALQFQSSTLTFGFSKLLKTTEESGM